MDDKEKHDVESVVVELERLYNKINSGHKELISTIVSMEKELYRTKELLIQIRKRIDKHG